MKNPVIKAVYECYEEGLMEKKAYLKILRAHNLGAKNKTQKDILKNNKIGKRWENKAVFASDD